MINTLKNHDVPQVPDALIDVTVHLAKKEFERTGTLYKISFLELLVGQIKYISPYLWGIQAALLLIISGFLFASNGTHNADQSIIVILSMASPIIALVVIPELAKSFNHHMWEMESACKFNLQKLVAIRLILIGVIDLFIITIIIIITSIVYELNLLNIILYILVPFNLASSVYLFILRKLRGKAATMTCLAAGVFIASGVRLLVLHSEFYTWASTFIWTVLFLCSTIVLVYELTNIVKSFLEGEKLVWNLP